MVKYSFSNMIFFLNKFCNNNLLKLNKSYYEFNRYFTIIIIINYYSTEIRFKQKLIAKINSQKKTNKTRIDKQTSHND